MICVEGSLSDVVGECSESAAGGALVAKLVTRFDFFASFPAEYRKIFDLYRQRHDCGRDYEVGGVGRSAQAEEREAEGRAHEVDVNVRELANASWLKHDWMIDTKKWGIQTGYITSVSSLTIRSCRQKA
jgi:hypothetical protein